MAIDAHCRTSPLAAAEVQPLGELGERISRVARRLLQDDVYRPEWVTSDITFAYDPTPFNDWYTGHEWTWYADVSGRYLNAMTSLAACLGALPDKAKRVARIVFAHQAAAGHFGPNQPLDACDRSQASGTAWMLLALPRYYALTGDRRALRAARRLAQWYADVTPFWLRPDVIATQCQKNSYALIFSNFTHCLDGLAALWEVDPRDQYLDLARRIAGAVKSYDQEIHSHHFLSTIRGLLDWYLLTGDELFLSKARAERQNVAERGLLDTGGVPEVFTNPHTDEGCSEVDWVLINLKLHLITGATDFLEAAERGIYGHLFMSQCANGGFGHWSGFHAAAGPMAPGAVGRHVEAYWCCSMHGAYGLAEIARHIVTVRGNQVRVNLYLGCQADVRLPVGRVRLTHSGLAYPAPGQVRLRVDLRTGADLHLELRLPRTMPLREARLDGTAVANGESPGEVLPLHLDGSGVREIALDFAPAVRSEPCRRPDVFGQRCSLWFGPMPLGTNALPKHVRFSVDPATLAELRPEPASRRGAFPSEVEFSLPAQDAPDFEHTRERRRVVLYPLAANGFRKLSYLNYLF